MRRHAQSGKTVGTEALALAGMRMGARIALMCSQILSPPCSFSEDQFLKWSEQHAIVLPALEPQMRRAANQEQGLQWADRAVAGGQGFPQGLSSPPNLA